MRVRTLSWLAAILFATPAVALAHLVNSGLGPVYDGALHLLMSPGDLLGLLALALLAGLRGAQTGRVTLVTLALAWSLGGLAGMNLPVVPELPLLVVISLVVPAVMVALDLKLAPLVVAVLAGLYGALHGLLNGFALASIDAGYTALLGSLVSVLMLSLLVSAAVVPLQGIWSRIAVRVVGSWVAAVGILMLGWLTRGNV